MIPILYNLRSLAVRRTNTAAAALGVALVAFVFSTAIMLSRGVKRTLAKSGSADVAIVLRKGSEVELSSAVETRQMALILNAPGVQPDAAGAPIGMGEITVVLAMEKLGTTSGGVSNVQVRGVADNVFALRPGVSLIAGRKARPGTDEAIVGRGIRGRFRSLDLGGEVELRKGRAVRIVGVFADGGSSFESELWCDLDVARAAFGRHTTVSSVRAKLTSESAYDAFAAYIERDKQLGLAVYRETDYYAKQSEGLAKFVIIVGQFISMAFAFGAMIGAMITMHAAVSDREREIGTLRAIGFSRRQILMSFLLESMLLALGGGLIGSLASTVMGLAHFTLINPRSWSEMVFVFEPHPRVVFSALVNAGLMGLLGGLLPAIRAAGIEPARAMRG